MHPRHWAVLMGAALAVSACGSTSPAASPAGLSSSPAASIAAGPSATPAPASVAAGAASPAASGDDPYALTLPSGWVAFDPGNPATKTALDAFVSANPAMAPMISTFETSKLYKLSVNQLTGDMLVTLAIPAQGLTLAQIGQALSAQFATLPGTSAPASPDPTTLPAGNALHWPITVSANKATGGTLSVQESVYVVSNGKTAVMIEFVTPAGGVPADEASILNTLVFK